MRTYEKRIFRGKRRSPWCLKLSNFEFRHCDFYYCVLWPTRWPRARALVRDVRLTGCGAYGCNIASAIFEDVFVDGIKTGTGGLWLRRCAFKHVTLQGNIGFVQLVTSLTEYWGNDRVLNRYAASDAAYYEKVDWALDISGGRFSQISIAGVPARLVRRNPETQAVVTRERLAQSDWRSLDLCLLIQIQLANLLDRGDPDVVLIAPKRSRGFREYLDGLNRLRQAGIAEPD